MNFVGVASARKFRGIFRLQAARQVASSGDVVASSELKFH